MCLTTGGGGECWLDWTHHYTVGDGWGSDLRHLVGQNQNLQVSPLFPSVPPYCARSNPVQLQVGSPKTESLGGFVEKKIGFFKVQLV